MVSLSPAELQTRAERIRLVLADCDGVLTDGGVYYSERGEELKRFHFHDGMAVRLLRERAGIETGFVSGEMSPHLKRRAEKLGVRELHLGISDKVACLELIAVKHDLPFDRIAYIGDDLNDLQILQQVGLSACPRNAVKEVRELVHWHARKRGGQGAFREFADWIIAARGGTR